MKTEIPILAMSKDEYLEMLESKTYDLFSKYEPRGLFILEDEGMFTAIDNYDGDAWVECFKTSAEAVAWLRGDFEMTEVDSFEFNYDDRSDIFDRNSVRPTLEEYLPILFDKIDQLEDRYESGFLNGDENWRYEIHVYESGNCSWRIAHSFDDTVVSQSHFQPREGAVERIINDFNDREKKIMGAMK